MGRAYQIPALDSSHNFAPRNNAQAHLCACKQGHSRADNGDGVWLGWSYGVGIMGADPQVAAAGNGTVYAVIQDAWGVVWYRGYTEWMANGWQGWTCTNGVLQSGSPVAVGGELYMAGRDGNNGLSWYRATGNQWTYIGNRGVAAGPLAAAPR